MGRLGDVLIKWLAPMVVANFKRDSPFHRYYCTTCYSVFFRDKCGNSTTPSNPILICPNSSPNHHQLHKILQVYLASHAFCIRREDIETLWNPSDICVYVINNHSIYFIQQKQKSTKFLVGNHHHRSSSSSRVGYCRICGYKLIQPHTSFCSIQCKFTDLKRLSTSQQRSTIEHTKIRKIESPADVDEEEEEDSPSSVMSLLASTDTTTLQLYQSLRKRPRKSLHPQRAPLF